MSLAVLPSTMVINTDPSTQQHTIVVVCIVSPIISGLFVAIRVWTRTFVTHSLSWDDCKLPHPHFLVALPSNFIDAALVTLVRTSSRWPLLSPTTHENQTALLYRLQCSSCIRCAYLLFRTSYLFNNVPGTNYGIGWHTTDLQPSRYHVYALVQDSRHIF